MSNTSNDDDDDWREHEDEFQENCVDKKRMRDAQECDECPVDFPISRNPDAPTTYNLMQEIINLMTGFGKKTNVNYTCDSGSGKYWVFTCKGCLRVKKRRCAYVPMIHMNKRYKLGIEQPDEPKYPTTKHEIIFGCTKKAGTDENAVYLLIYRATHHPACTRATCSDDIPEEELPMNNFAKKVGRAICALIDSHIAREDQTLTFGDLSYIEQLERIFRQMRPSYALELSKLE